MRLARLKNLSTGALNGVAVLYFIDRDFILGNWVRILISDPEALKYSFTSASAVSVCDRSSSSNEKKSLSLLVRLCSGWGRVLLTCSSSESGLSGDSKRHSEISNVFTASLLSCSFNQRSLNFGKVTAARRAPLSSIRDENLSLIACKIKLYIRQ